MLRRTVSRLRAARSIVAQAAIFCCSTLSRTRHQPPGHTLGHQTMKVKLASGQTVILAADAISIKENLEGYPSVLNYSVRDYTNSVNRLKFMRDLEGAEIFMAHDQDQYKEKGGKWFK